MLFHVKMPMKLPVDIKPPRPTSSRPTRGSWPIVCSAMAAGTTLWRIQPSVEALHHTLMQLPLFPYMDIEVAGLCCHPSSIHSNDR